MEYTLKMEKVKAQLQRELDTIRNAERESAWVLNMFRRIDPFVDLGKSASRLRENQILICSHYERARAVFELLGADSNELDLNADALEAAIQALK